jgi:hypothetical protein
MGAENLGFSALSFREGFQISVPDKSCGLLASEVALTKWKMMPFVEVAEVDSIFDNQI